MTKAAWALAVLLALPGAAQTPVSPQDQETALDHYRRGQALMFDESFDRAAAEFRRAVAIDPLLTLAHYGLGQASMNLKAYPEAVAAFEGCRDAYLRIGELATRQSADAERRRDDEVRELRETITAIRTGRVKVDQPQNAVLRLESRIRDLDRSRQRGQEAVTVPAEVSFSLGSAYFRSGRLEDAERGWKAAVDTHADFGEAWNNLAALYLMTERPRLAAEAVTRAERAGFPVHPQLKADIRKAIGGRSVYHPGWRRLDTRDERR